jgi:autotransporter-associated beta strand protein
MPAVAQSVWGGTGSTTATSAYGTATNWSNPPGVAPTAAGTSAVFANTGQNTVNVGAITTDSWTFATNAQSYAISGLAVTFNTNAGLIDNANAGQSISIANSLNGAGAQLMLNGNSTLTLLGANTYTGATTIGSGATLALSSGVSISNSSVVTANGTFDISASAAPFNPITTLAGTGTVQLGSNGLVITTGSTEFSGMIAGTGGIEIAGGTQTLSGVNTYTNATQIDPGATLALKGNGSIANSAFISFSPGFSTSHFDISQTNSGASVAGLFDPIGIGVVSLGSKTLTFTSSAGFFNGVIQDGGIGGGTGGNVTIANGGLATFGGVNTYTGLTTINAGGELDMSGNGSIAASKAVINNGIFDISCLCSSSGLITSLSGASTGIVNLGPNTLIITNGNGTFAGVIQDGGAGGGLTIAGGKEILTGANTYTGATTITGGTLELDGSITGSSGMTVNSGGTLSGTGLVDPPTTTINNGGTLAPGSTSNPTGKLTLAGNLVFQSAATYLVTVGGANASNTQVNGTATLGGTVQAAFASPATAKTYDILRSAGLGGTTFSGVTSANPNYAASLSYTPTDALLNVNAQLGGGGGLTPGQRTIANTINTAFNNGGTLPPGLANLFGLTGNNLSTGLSQVSGQAATGAEIGVFQLMDEFLNLMLDPFLDGRLGGFAGSAGGGAIGFAPDREATLPPEIALAYASILKAPPKPTFDQRWTAWGAAYGGANTTNGDPAAGTSNVNAQTFGFAGGMDYHLSPDTVVGFALAGGGTNWGLANALGGGRSDASQAGVYGFTHAGPAYLAGALAFANHWFTTNRSALGEALTANFAGQSYGARLEGGYRYAVLPTLGVAPYAAVQAQDFHTPTYSETDQTGGGLGLTFASMNATDVRTELGTRLDAPTLVAGMPLILRGRVAWAHDFVNKPALSAAFQALPGGSFIVNGAAIPQNSALTSVGAELFLTQRWTLLAKFDGEFANGSQTYAGSGTLRYTW